LAKLNVCYTQIITPMGRISHSHQKHMIDTLSCILFNSIVPKKDQLKAKYFCFVKQERYCTQHNKNTVVSRLCDIVFTKTNPFKIRSSRNRLAYIKHEKQYK